MSSTTTSGRSSGIFISAMRPLDAEPTTRISGVRASASVSDAADDDRVVDEEHAFSAHRLRRDQAEELELFANHVAR